MKILVPAIACIASLSACSSSSSSNAAHAADGGLADGESIDGGAATMDGSIVGADGGADANGADASTTGNGLAWTSGSRLRAIVDTAETAQVFTGWHDKLLDIDCTYSLASDGKMRCLPQADVFVGYDDSNCTNPVALVPKTGPAVKYLPPPNSKFVCGAGTAFHSPGAVYAPAQIYTFNNFTCDLDTSLHPDLNAVHVGAVVPPATFVAETEGSDPRGARLAAHQYVGDDGSRQDFEMLDKSRKNAPCRVSEDRDGKYYCTPSELAYLEYFFSDATCTAAVGFHPEYAQQVCGRIPTAIQDSTGNAAMLTFFEVGVKTSTPIHQKDGTTCPLVPTGGAAESGTFYAPAAPIPITSLAALPITHEGSGRMQLLAARTESGALGATLGFFDSQKKTACNKSLATDGKTRCLPQTFNRINSFSDAQCTQGIFDTTLAALPAGSLLNAQGALRYSNAVFVIGAKIATPTSLWQWTGELCEASTPQAVDYYATTAVPPSDLVLVTTAVE